MRSLKIRFKIVVAMLFLLACDTNSPFDDFKICPERCSHDTPWRVETLNTGLPCFARMQECLEWAETNGYTDFSCVKCD
jgi:hypothetical protein